MGVSRATGTVDIRYNKRRRIMMLPRRIVIVNIEFVCKASLVVRSKRNAKN